MKRVFKSSGASDEEIEAMRAAMEAAGIEFTERRPSFLGGGQAGFWVEDVDTADRARQVIEQAQAEWIRRVRADPSSVEVTSIFGSDKRLVWITCVLVVILHIVLLSELFFGW